METAGIEEMGIPGVLVGKNNEEEEKEGDIEETKEESKSEVEQGAGEGNSDKKLEKKEEKPEEDAKLEGKEKEENEDEKAEPAAPQRMYVRLRGLPWHVSKQQIQDFFLPLSLLRESIIIIRGPDGRDSGEALVELKNEENAELAMTKDKQFIGKRSRWGIVFDPNVEYVELFRANPTEWNHIKGNQPEPSPRPKNTKSSVLLLRGLPYATTEEQIRQFFAPTKLVAVHFTKDELGRASGQSYLEVENKEDQGECMKKHRQYMGERYIEIFRSNISELTRVLRGVYHRKPNRRRMNMMNPEIFVQQEVPMFYPGGYPQPPCCLRMRGLPFNTTEGGIVNFFADARVTPSRIHRKQDGSEAYVEFRTQIERDCAMQMQNAFLGNRYIELFPVDFETVMMKVGIGAPVMTQRLPMTGLASPVAMRSFAPPAMSPPRSPLSPPFGYSHVENFI